MIPFGITAPARVLFGRGEAAKAPGLIRTIWRVRVSAPAPEVASVAPTAPAEPA